LKIFDFFALFWNDLPLFLHDFGVFLNTVIGYQLSVISANDSAEGREFFG
jgi:hypothetical protein